MSKILVTGATGLLGGNLVRALAHRHEDVRVMLRATSATSNLEELDVEIVFGDVTDADSVASAMQGVDLVYHGASRATQWRRLEPLLRRVNVVGTRNVCGAALSAGVRRLVHISSATAVGIDFTGSSVDETHSWGPGAADVPWATTKHRAELVVRDHVAAGLDAVIVNPTTMLGPWDYKPTSARMILSVASGRTHGYPTGGDNFVDVRDVVTATIQAMETGVCGRRYILGGHNMTYEDVFKVIADVVGEPAPRLRYHPTLTLAAGAFGDLWGSLTGRHPPLSSVEAKLACVNHYYDSSRAHRELDMPCTPVRHAVSDAWEWFVDHGYTGDEGALV